MRELEQEQFQQFCKLNGIGTENAEEIVSNDEDPNKQPTTSE
jgi:Holliday junction resolvasome RuvABC DNA-binding subunit